MDAKGDGIQLMRLCIVRREGIDSVDGTRLELLKLESII